jgi:hypothetical protein
MFARKFLCGLVDCINWYFGEQGCSTTWFALKTNNTFYQTDPFFDVYQAKTTGWAELIHPKTYSTIRHTKMDDVSDTF